VSRTVEGIDDSALSAAQQALGTTGTRDTVNTALREVVRQKLVQAFIDRMSAQDPAELTSLRDAAWR
jgi:Arc/MetJ family transcription regulator